MANRALRDSDVRFAPEPDDDDELDVMQQQLPAKKAPAPAPARRKKAAAPPAKPAPSVEPEEDEEEEEPQDKRKHGGDAAGIGALNGEKDEAEEPQEDLKEPKAPADVDDPKYKAALEKYKAALEQKRKRSERVEARRKAIRVGKAEAMRDLRRRVLTDQSWWGYLDFGEMMDRLKDKIMPRAQRKVARATFDHWLSYFELGWKWWASFAWVISSAAISLGVPIYILLLQRGMFYDWWVGNHRPDVAIIKPRTRR